MGIRNETLHQAARVGDVEGIYRLIAEGADPDALDSMGSTPLLIGCTFGHLEVVKALVGVRADPERIDPNKASTVHRAASFGHRSVVNFLVSHTDVGLETVDVAGRTPLHAACKFGHVCTAKELILAGVFVDPIDVYGQTPLHLAAYYGFYETVNYLIENGADPRVLDRSRKTPADLAEERSNVKVLYVLQNGRLPEGFHKNARR